MNRSPAGLRFESLESWCFDGDGGPAVRGRRRDGEPMLHFLHGNGFSCGTYAPFLEALAGDAGLVTQDLEGHGESDPVPSFRGTEVFLQRSRSALLAQLGARAVVGVAHSLGASLSLHWAVREPARFSALVLLDPILSIPGQAPSEAPGGSSMAARTRRRRDRWPSREAALDHLRGRGLYAGWDEAALAGFIRSALRNVEDGVALACHRDVEAAAYEQPMAIPAGLAGLRLPILLITGRESYPFMPGLARALCRINPAIEAQTVPGGHCFPLERPQATAQRVRRFLAARRLLERV